MTENPHSRQWRTNLDGETYLFYTKTSESQQRATDQDKLRTDKQMHQEQADE